MGVEWLCFTPGWAPEGGGTGAGVECEGLQSGLQLCTVAKQKLCLGKCLLTKCLDTCSFTQDYTLLSCFLGLVVQGSSDLSPLPQKGDHGCTELLSIWRTFNQ